MLEVRNLHKRYCGTDYSRPGCSALLLFQRHNPDLILLDEPNPAEIASLTLS